jgi:hypothetical protein
MNKRVIPRLLSLLICAVLLCGAPAASASPVTFNLEGVITASGIDGYGDGQSISGSITFDLSQATASHNTGTVLSYDDVIETFRIGGFVDHTGGDFISNAIVENNNHVVDLVDSISFALFSSNSSDQTQFSLQSLAEGTNPTAVTSLAIPLSPWDLSAFTSNTFRYENNEGIIVADLSSIALAVPAPEPSTWAMMIFGFCGIGYLGRRRRQMVQLAQLD